MMDNGFGSSRSGQQFFGGHIEAISWRNRKALARSISPRSLNQRVSHSESKKCILARAFAPLT